MDVLLQADEKTTDPKSQEDTQPEATKGEEDETPAALKSLEDENPAKPDGKNVHEVLGKPKKGDAVKVEGVGAGAVAAASLHSGFDLESLTSGNKWDAGAPVPYAFLVAAFNEIAPQSKRLAIIASLTNHFRCVIRLSPEDLLPMVYLCTSRVRQRRLWT